MTKKGSGKQAMGNADFGKQRIAAALGAGPAKFGPYTPEVTAQAQLKTLPIEQLGIFAQVTIACGDAGIQKKFTTNQMLRVLRFTGFNEKKAFSLLKRMDPSFLDMTAQELQDQIMSKTLLPIPHLKAFTVQDMFYMRPSRFTPGETTVSAVIANLIYVMDSI
jgi:hypothetical protein